jgi:hypothetical protein
MLTFFVISVGLPLVAVLGNSFLRWAIGLPQSAPADLILVLIVFDITILIQPADLTIIVPNAPAFYGLVLIVCIVMWAIAVSKERDLQDWARATPPKGYPFALTFTCFGVSALVTNLAPIAARSLR